jgi:hypothetical protein
VFSLFKDWLLLNKNSIKLEGLKLCPSKGSFNYNLKKTLSCIDKYYLNNSVSRSSRVMIECQLNHDSNSNF